MGNQVLKSKAPSRVLNLDYPENPASKTMAARRSECRSQICVRKEVLSIAIKLCADTGEQWSSIDQTDQEGDLPHSKTSGFTDWEVIQTIRPDQKGT